MLSRIRTGYREIGPTSLLGSLLVLGALAAAVIIGERAGHVNSAPSPTKSDRRGDYWLREFAIALVVGLIVAGAAWRLDVSLADREVRRDDIRFVRETAVSESPIRPFSGLRLDGAALSGFDLSGADFRRSSLEEVDFRNSVLAGADLRNTSLRGAVLFRTILDNANLQLVDLSGLASAAEASFDGADLRGVNLDGVNLNFASFVGADLGGIDAVPVELEIAGVLAPCGNIGCDLRSSSANGVRANRVDFSGANLRNMDLSGSRFWEVSMIDTNLVASRLVDTWLAGDLSGARFGGAELTGADLSEANLDGAVFVEEGLFDDFPVYRDLSAACWDPDRPPKWPDGFDVPPPGDWCHDL